MARTKRTMSCCWKMFQRMQDYEAHARTHYRRKNKPFKCDICDKSFGSQAWLTRHSKIHWEQIQVSGFESRVTDPFTIFPREIWCMILENVPYFRDRLRIFQAFPELEGFYRRKKQLYLFDQVVPHIAEWMEEEDLLECRLVARQWTTGVDNFLENHPSRRPYPQDGADQQSTSPVWDRDPISYSKCYHGQSFDNVSLEHFAYRKYLDGANSFRFNNIYRFLLKTQWRPVDINPFVGRSIKVVFDVEDRRVLSQKFETIIKNFLKNLHTLLKKWGSHIWFLTIVMIENELQSEEEFVDFLQKSLACLPNLKSLHIVRTYGLALDQAGRNYADINLPELPHLEVLRVSDTDFLSDPLVSQMLLPHYSMQIRRLHLELEYDDDSSYARIPFPNLKELLISGCSPIRECEKEFENIISCIDAPQLTSLGFKDWKYSYPNYRTLNSDCYSSFYIFEWLHRFPCSKHLYLPHLTGEYTKIHTPDDFSDDSDDSEGIPSAREDCIYPSLDSICLHINTLRPSQDIFHFFPSLQCLQIFANLPWSANPPESEEECFRICSLKLQLKDVRGLFQTLKKLTVIVIIAVAYGRETGPRYRLQKQQLKNTYARWEPFDLMCDRHFCYDD